MYSIAELFRLLRERGLAETLLCVKETPPVERILQGAAVDSREAKPGLAFVARKGARQDSHSFLEAAFQSGIRCFLVQEDWREKSGGTSLEQLGDSILIPTPNPETALLTWAQHYRRSLANTHILGISGSYGKTTVKELASRILEQKYRVFATPGNRNAPIGCALSLLGISPAAEIAILEMGIDHPGEMDLLTSIVQPNSALITAIGSAHLGAFQDKTELAREKGKIYRGLHPVPNPAAPVLSGSCAFLPSQDPFLPILEEQVPQTAKKCYFNFDRDPQTGAAAAVSDLALDGIKISYSGSEFSLPLLGTHHQQAFWATVKAAETFGLDLEQIGRGTALFRPLFGRSEIVRGPARVDPRRRLIILRDCYNASPESVSALLHWLRTEPSGQPCILVLADMLELGGNSPEIHREILEQALQNKHTVYLYGKELEKAFLTLRRERDKAPPSFENPSIPQVIQTIEKIIEKIEEKLLSFPQKIVPLLVLKGARAAQLEKISSRLLR